jgi:transposase
MARHSHLPPAQRVDLVLAVLRGTEKLEVLARRHQVSTNTLRRWRDEFVAAGRDRLTGQGDAVTAALENKRLVKELAERELIIGEITVANRFLKKTLDASNGTLPGGKT